MRHDFALGEQGQSAIDRRARDMEAVGKVLRWEMGAGPQDFGTDVVEDLPRKRLRDRSTAACGG
jgi:hypothetical protein